MAKCDEGYLCEVCGREVKGITESDLYLRYVTGEIDGQALLASPERHLRCNPFLAQFIVDSGFAPISVDGPFSKEFMEPTEVVAKEDLVTRGWRRLREVRKLGLPISEYPLEEVRSEK
ncbi:MAG: hypothetical protein M3552_13000 [Planctomycetota bacterium]|nr:hypothetical protein [Planctomycetaceae bacterium]MDQ3331550.1 hypothetical protein [Planctomycetota bacterium]